MLLPASERLSCLCIASAPRWSPLGTDRLQVLQPPCNSYTLWGKWNPFDPSNQRKKKICSVQKPQWFTESLRSVPNSVSWLWCSRQERRQTLHCIEPDLFSVSSSTRLGLHSPLTSRWWFQHNLGNFLMKFDSCLITRFEWVNNIMPDEMILLIDRLHARWNELLDGFASRHMKWFYWSTWFTPDGIIVLIDLVHARWNDSLDWIKSCLNPVLDDFRSILILSFKRYFFHRQIISAFEIFPWLRSFVGKSLNLSIWHQSIKSIYPLFCNLFEWLESITLSKVCQEIFDLIHLTWIIEINKMMSGNVSTRSSDMNWSINSTISLIAGKYVNLFLWFVWRKASKPEDNRSWTFRRLHQS